MKTVFVIGAGAGKEVGMPLGDELKELIAERLWFRFDKFGERLVNGDPLIFSTLRMQFMSYGILNDYIARSRDICQGLPLSKSIDNYVHSHRMDKKIIHLSKLGISRLIAEFESQSDLFVDPSTEVLKLRQINETWLIPFFQNLVEGCSKDEISNRLKEIILIVFNYDRVIEHFLYHALKLFYKISHGEVEGILENLKIYHPYGSIGGMPWPNTGQGFLKFGETLEERKLLRLVERIKTFSEGTVETDAEIMEIRDAIQSCDRLIFLGFAFHQINMDLLKPVGRNESHSISTNCFASCYGISSSDQEVIRQTINNLLGKAIDSKLDNQTCSEFMRSYSLSLKFS